MFAFFSQPRNLERITPPWLRFRIEDGPDRAVGAGAEITYRLRLHGVPLTWVSRICVWEPPERFVDEQIRGPYRSWRHEHRFEDRAAGTGVVDAVDYEVFPGRWPLDAVVDRLFVRRDVERIFAHRREVIADLFGG